MFLGVFLEEQAQDVALLVSVLKFDMVLPGDRLGFLVGLDLVKVNAGVLLHRVEHGDTRKGLAKVDLDAVVGDFGGAEHLLTDVAVHFFGQVHHAVVVGVCLIELHQRKLGIVARVHALVAEDPADLIDALQAADDQSFEIQLERNAELEVLVKRVGMRDERTRRGAACIGDEHGRLDLDKALCVEKTADRADR